MVAILVTIITIAFQKPVKISEVVLILVCVPRLHDIGRSGWIEAWVFLAEIVVVVGAVFLIPDPDMAAAAMGVMVLVIAGLLIWLGCIPSDRVANAYGDQPGPGIALRPKA